ncbi:MAG: hypothetical protein H7837_04285 [Magnetococcus sp. MYC-9]
MVNALTETAAGGAGSAQHAQNVAAASEQIRTRDNEQLQARNVEPVQSEGDRVQTDQSILEARARAEEILRQRAARVSVLSEAVETKRISQEQAAARMQRTANPTPEVRDGSTAAGNQPRLDVAA